MREGICEDGPLAGREVISRFPLGFLLVDKPNNECWIYEWVGTGFRVRDMAPMPVDIAKRDRAAEGSDYDVLAAPWIGGDNLGYPRS